MAAYFERVKRFENDTSITLPTRKTINSAGYDFCVAEETVIPSYLAQMKVLADCLKDTKSAALTLEEMSEVTKLFGIKPTLVPTGIKAKLDAGTYLQLSVRSSCPLKYWLVLANGVGIIDADYYGNTSNDGEIFFQLINMSPYPIILKKYDTIGQGIILPYIIKWDDFSPGHRTGGFGSTDK